MKPLKYDLHIHSCLSPCGDSDMTPNNIAGMSALNGIRVAALTDHNTSKNCPAFFEACRRYGVVPIAGMELTTLEEIHTVCLFPTLEAAMDFDAYVDSHRMKIKNKPSIFGEQVIMNENDEIIGYEDSLLIMATNIDLNDTARIVYERGGVAFPAHIDKQSNSVTAILGDFPPDPGFTAFEVHDMLKLPKLREKYPIIKGLFCVTDSDAHLLESMNIDPPIFDGVEDNDNEEEIRQAIIKKLRGEI